MHLICRRCRKNIGLGSDFDEIARFTSDSSSCPSAPPPLPSLPYSLPKPLLSRRPGHSFSDPTSSVTSEKPSTSLPSENEKAFPGLPYTLGSSLSSYLLKLLDSPAYSNLTPEYLNDYFNPATPDRDDIRYFSIGGRANKMGVWHPLWLPKLILDAAEAMRHERAGAEGQDQGNFWKGNDGLVSLESARWGEYLGTVECDHWELRGAAGFIRPPKGTSTTAKSEEVTGTGDKEKDASKQSASSSSSSLRWGWQDVNALIGTWINAKQSERRDATKASAASPPTQTTDSNGLPKDPLPAQEKALEPTDRKETKPDSASALHSVANWVTQRIPLAQSFSVVPSPPLPTGPDGRPASFASSMNPGWPLDECFEQVKSDASDLVPRPNAAKPIEVVSPISSSPGAAPAPIKFIPRPSPRLLYGLSPTPASSSRSGKTTKFELERLYVAVCKKLYDEGF